MISRKRTLKWAKNEKRKESDNRSHHPTLFTATILRSLQTINSLQVQVKHFTREKGTSSSNGIYTIYIFLLLVMRLAFGHKNNVIHSKHTNGSPRLLPFQQLRPYFFSATPSPPYCFHLLVFLFDFYFCRCLDNGTWFHHPESGLQWSNYTTCVDVGDLEVNRLHHYHIFITFFCLLMLFGFKLSHFFLT